MSSSARLVVALALLGAGPSAAQAVFTVNSVADLGTGACDATECTLREAITAANAAANGAQPDRIHFAIPGTGLHTITPASALPTITDPVVIDGNTSEFSAAFSLAGGVATEAGPVRLSVVDALGREVAVLVDDVRAASPGQADFDASALAVGTYTVRLGAGALTQTHRLVVVR